MSRRRKSPIENPAIEVFVDREEPKRTFEDAVFSIPKDNCNLRTWYGVGGQGKTALARELFRLSSAEIEPSYTHIRRAMLDLHGRSKTDPEQLLVWIRNAFAKSGLSFPAFDLAFAIMWEQTRGEEPFPKLEKPWLHRTREILSDNSSDTIMFSRELLEEFAETIPGLGFLAKRGTRWAFDKSRKAWLEHSRQYLKVLYKNGELIPDYEISDLMPWILAQDMNHHIKTNPNERFVLFIDEYESVFDGAGMGMRWQENKFDSHMRSFVAETNGILALFFSREKLPWENDPDWADVLKGHQHLLGGLSDFDANDWLMKIPVNDSSLRKAMIDGARETTEKEDAIYPLMLDLQVAHWQKVGERATAEDFQVTATSFQGRLEVLVRRLLRDYPKPVEEALSYLSIPLRFDEKTFQFIVQEYNLPLSFNDFSDLKDLSIVTEAEDGWLSLHRAVADTIVQSFNAGTLDKGQTSLHKYFEERATPEQIIDVNDDTLSSFKEAARLRLQENLNGYVGWLKDKQTKISAAAKHKFLESIWQEALQTCLSNFSESHIDVAVCYNHLAETYDGQGKYEAAEPLYLKSLEIMKQLIGEEHMDTATGYKNLAENLRHRGKYEAAEPLYLKSLETMKQLIGEEHSDTATCINYLADNYRAQGKYEKAAPFYKKSLEIKKRILGEEHADIAICYNNIASILTARGKLEDATPLYKKSLNILERALGEEHPHVATSCNNLAGNLTARGKYKDATSLHQRCLEIYERVLGVEHPHTATCYLNLAYNFQAQADYQMAEVWYQKSLALRERLLNKDHPDVAVCYQLWASSMRAQGKYEAAEPLYQRALNINKRAFGEDNLKVAISYSDLASCLSNLEKYEDALKLYQYGIKICIRVLGEKYLQTAIMYNNLSGVLSELKHDEEAYKYAVRSYQIVLEIFGTESIWHGRTLIQKAIAEHKLGKSETAIKTISESINYLEIYEPLKGNWLKKARDAEKRILGG